MKELVVLGFASRELAEEARSVGAELDREGVLQLDGAALAYRRDDGRVELVQPMRLAPVGAASGAAAGGVLGLLLEPVLFAAVGAVAGAAGAGLSALGLNQWFLHQLDETLEPGRAALFVVVNDADPEPPAGRPERDRGRRVHRLRHDSGGRGRVRQRRPALDRPDRRRLRGAPGRSPGRPRRRPRVRLAHDLGHHRGRAVDAHPAAASRSRSPLAALVWSHDNPLRALPGC